MAIIDIDRDAAHDAAQHELAKANYPRASLGDLVEGWMDDLLHEIMAGGASVPGGWLTVGVLLVLVAVAVVVAVRVARRTMGTNRGRQSLMSGVREMSSAEHRATAEQFAAAGDWPSAIRHRLRAVARHLEETAVLRQGPGRTATELARDASQEIPGLTAELHSAADIFNDVTYGELPGSEGAYRVVADLDDHLLAHLVPSAGAEPIPATGDTWAQVR